MKKFIGLFLFVFLVAGLQNVSAQKELKEGNITIGITDLQVDDPSAAAQIGMFKTATMNWKCDGRNDENANVIQ